MAFKIGDIVRLKSGGPKMVVTQNQTSEINAVFVNWFTTNSEQHGTGSFPPQTLLNLSENYNGNVSEKRGTPQSSTPLF